MCKFKGVVKTRQVRRALSKLGCRLLRQSGSHETWETPSGRKLPIVLINEDDLRNRIVKAILTALIAEGLMSPESELRDLNNL